MSDETDQMMQGVVSIIVKEILQFIDNTKLTDSQACVIISALQNKRAIDPWEDHEDYPVDDWKYEVTNGDTRLGYVEWRAHQIDNFDGAPQTWVEHDPPGPIPSQIQNMRDAGRPGQ